MFFNVSREKSGRPGRFYYVMMTYWTQFGPRLAISTYSPTQYSTRILHTEQLQEPKAQWRNVTSQGVRVERIVNKMTTEGARD